MKKFAIGIAHHKKGEFYTKEPYIPIQVGAVYKEDWGIQKDNEGDNISYANPYCSEMTAVYWIWKNTCADYKGLFHYRRFLNYNNKAWISRLPQLFIYLTSKVISPFVRDVNYAYASYTNHIIREKDVAGYLSKFAEYLEKDVEKNHVDCYCLGSIINSNRKMKSILKESIGLWHYDIACKILKEEMPHFYPYFEKTLYSGRFHSCNIIIAKSTIFEEYCNIMFSFLERYHGIMNEGIDSEIINKAMTRDSGYIAEIITDAFIVMLKERGAKVKGMGQVTVETLQTSESQAFSSFWSKVKEALR